MEDEVLRSERHLRRVRRLRRARRTGLVVLLMALAALPLVGLAGDYPAARLSSAYLELMLEQGPREGEVAAVCNYHLHLFLRRGDRLEVLRLPYRAGSCRTGPGDLVCSRDRVIGRMTSAGLDLYHRVPGGEPGTGALGGLWPDWRWDLASREPCYSDPERLQAIAGQAAAAALVGAAGDGLTAEEIDLAIAAGAAVGESLTEAPTFVRGAALCCPESEWPGLDEMSKGESDD